ncbi:MAG: flagellar motor protein MotB [Alphaproteobacteria bacterium]
MRELDFMPAAKPSSMLWLLTFADLISLLLTFFVMIYSTKELDTTQWDKLRGALVGIFTQQEAVIVVHPDDTQVMDSVVSVPSDNLQYLQHLLEKEFENDAVLSTLRFDFDGAAQQLRLALPASSLFGEKGAGELTKPARLALMKLADKLRHVDNALEVVGHSEPRDDAREVAMQRAITVLKVLQERGAAKNSAATSRGMAEFDTLLSTLTPAEKVQRAQRVDIVLLQEAPNGL